MLHRLATLTAVALLTLPLSAGDLAADMQAKLLKVVIASSGGGKISCSDSALKTALESQGVDVASGGSIVWASNINEAKMAKLSGSLVIAGRRDLLASAGIILEEEGGKPKIILNMANLKAARVKVGDAIFKLGEKI